MFVNISSLVIPFRCIRSTCDCESLIFWAGIGGRHREQISSSLPIPRKRGLLCLSFVGMYSLQLPEFYVYDGNDDKFDNISKKKII